MRRLKLLAALPLAAVGWLLFAALYAGEEQRPR